MIFNRLKWVYLVGFFLILALPLLSLPPWFSPPDWGKTIVFKIILSILIFAFLWQTLSKKQVSFKTSLPFWLLVALFLIYFLTTIFSLDPYFSFFGNPYRAGGFLNFAFYIIFAILVFFILKESDWQKIWDFEIITGILVSLIAVFQWKGILKGIVITYENRPPATVGNPIFLAIYLLLLIFMALSFGIKEKKLNKKIFYFLSIFIFIFVIFLTYTRATYLGLAAGFLYFLFFYPKRLALVKISFLIILILGVIGVYYLSTQSNIPSFIEKNRLLKGAVSRISIETILKDPRFSAWKVSWQALKAKPLLGYGPENFSIGFDKYYDPSLPYITKEWGSWWDRAHNFIFDISLQAGIFALIIYLLLFGVIFWQLQKLKKDSGEKIIIYHGIQTTFLAYLVANFFSFDSFSTYLISFLLIGYSLYLISDANLQMKCESANKKIQRTVPWRLYKYRGVIVFSLFLFLVWFIWVFNIKPLEINKEIKVAASQAKIGNYKEALTKMEDLLKSRSFLDSYVRLNYIEIINGILAKSSEQTQISLAEKARQILKENTKIQPYYTKNWFLLGNYTNVLIEKGETDLKSEANYYFEKAHQLSPKRQEVFIYWIKTDFLTADYRGAKEKAKMCLDLNPESGDCWWQMALTNIYLSEKEMAKENIEIAREKGYSINSEISLLEMASAYFKSENYSELINIYHELIKINPAYEEKLKPFLKELY